MSRRAPKERIQRQQTVSSDFVDNAFSGPSRPLSNETRAFVEPKFGHSFANVRVFAEGAAPEAASALNAKAFTVGENIAFNAGRYDPDSAEGQRLLTHELSHTIQQGPVSGLPQQLEVSNPHDAGERGAQGAVASINQGFTPSLAPASSGASVQLEGEEEEKKPPPPPPAPVGSGGGGMPEEEEIQM
jgi:hypothetical protein